MTTIYGDGFVADRLRANSPHLATLPVGDLSSLSDGADTSMSDEELEYAIKQAGAELVRLQAVYTASSCFNDCAARDEAKRYMEALIRARSPAQIRHMERRLGLA